MNNTNNQSVWTISTLSSYVSEIVAKESGNVLGKNQESMVVSRLKKRLLDLGSLSPVAYYDYLRSNYNKEVSHLVSILTTHHTFFFREFCHYEYIINNLSTIVDNAKKRGSSRIEILSAACSRGQEVYSLAMLLQHHLKAFPGMTFKITGNDIDPQSVKVASNGVYPYSEVKSIPQVYLSGNWQRGTGDISRFVRVKKHLKEYCQFEVMNLLNPDEKIKDQKFDIIFCRNVFIYFDMKMVEEIVNNLRHKIHKNGLFITGLSESLKTLPIEKQTLAPSVYCFDKLEEEETTIAISTVTKNEVKTQDKAFTSRIPKPIKMLVVDDSASVLKLLSRIFEKDSDFELVGTAMNGIEAQEFLKNNTVDAMTLDIHMPEMDGVEYLKKNFKHGHPKVVVVSSASREDTRYAQETLKNGASDFVEKPALNNLGERAEEIKNKIKMSFLNTKDAITPLDSSFKESFEINNAHEKQRCFIANFSDAHKISATLRSLQGDQPPTFIFFEGNMNFLEMIKGEFKGIQNVEVISDKTVIAKNKIYICDLKEDFDRIRSEKSIKSASISIFGIASNATQNKVMNLSNCQVLLEDTEGINDDLKNVVNDVFPWTSFAHIGTEYLAKK